MSEGPPQAEERNDAIKIDGVALDRGVLDLALNDRGRGIGMKRVGETGLKSEFVMRMLVDKRSGRVLEATTQAGTDREADSDRTIVTVECELTQQADDQGRVTEEALTIKGLKLGSTEGMTPTAAANIKRLLETWREKHNIYIVNP